MNQCTNVLARYSGVVAISAALGPSVLAGVQKLELTGNGIRDIGAAALAAAFQRGSTPGLLRLYLNTNAIGDDGAAAFAAVLACFTYVPIVLTMTVPNTNAIGVDAAAALSCFTYLGLLLTTDLRCLLYLLACTECT